MCLKNIYKFILDEYLSKNIIKNITGSESIGLNHYDRF